MPRLGERRAQQGVEFTAPTTRPLTTWPPCEFRGPASKPDECVCAQERVGHCAPTLSRDAPKLIAVDGAGEDFLGHGHQQECLTPTRLAQSQAQMLALRNRALAQQALRESRGRLGSLRAEHPWRNRCCNGHCVSPPCGARASIKQPGAGDPWRGVHGSLLGRPGSSFEPENRGCACAGSLRADKCASSKEFPKWWVDRQSR